MVSQKNLTIYEILKEMKKLKNEIYSIETVLMKTIIPLSAITYKDIVAKGGNGKDKMINRVIKKEGLELDLENKIDSYNAYKEQAIQKIKEMWETKTVDEMIVFYRDELHWKWKDISKMTNFSTRQCIRKYENLVKKGNL